MDKIKINNFKQNLLVYSNYQLILLDIKIHYKIN
jgi:hypothetical protein